MLISLVPSWFVAVQVGVTSHHTPGLRGFHLPKHIRQGSRNPLPHAWITCSRRIQLRLNVGGGGTKIPTEGAPSVVGRPQSHHVHPLVNPVIKSFVWLIPWGHFLIPFSCDCNCPDAVTFWAWSLSKFTFQREMIISRICYESERRGNLKKKNMPSYAISVSTLILTKKNIRHTLIIPQFRFWQNVIHVTETWPFMTETNGRVLT